MAGSSWIYQTERVYLCLMMFPYWHSLYEITTLGFDFLCVWPAVVHPQGVSSGSSVALKVRRAAGTSADWRTGGAGCREQALAWFVLWRGARWLMGLEGQPCTSSPLSPSSPGPSCVHLYASSFSPSWFWSLTVVHVGCTFHLSSVSQQLFSRRCW